MGAERHGRVEKSRRASGRKRRARTKTILQMEAVECGAAALAMILAYHGRWVPLETLRIRCGVSRDGTKASNILKAGREYGLAGKGFRKEPDQLLTLPVPSIIHWNFNHFLVFEGIVGNQVYLNDPALGARRISFAEFEESFTGVVLAFEATEGFKPGGAPAPFWSALGRRLEGSRGGLALVLLASLLLIVPGVVTPVFSKIFVDQILIDRLGGWLKPLLAGMLAMTLLRGALVWLQSHYLTRLESKLGIVFGSQLVWHMLRLPMNFFSQRHGGDLANRVMASDQVALLLSAGAASATLGAASSVLFALAMAAFNPTLTAIVVPVTLMNALAVKLIGRKREAAANRLYKEQGLLASATVGTIRSIETIKASGLERDAFSRWAGFHAKELGAARDLDRTNARIGVVPSFLNALSNAAVLGAGSLQVMHGTISVGDLVAFIALANSFSEPIGRLVALAGGAQEIKATLARTSDVLAYPVEPRVPNGATMAAVSDGADAARLSGRIEIEGLTFGYNPQDAPLISDFDLSVQPGSRVALVGASGSGKSTLGKLICGLYAPWRGEIRLDGLPIATIPQAVLANSLAYVDQEVFLFAGSIRENLTIWDDSVADVALSSALQDAGMLADIAGRTGRYDALVSEAGINFSGGQRQRLEIARALVTNPSILVLDEAMAALDPIVEQEIDDNLRRRGCTCVIIAHRLSTIRDCDEIVMLSKGQVIGRGTHTELLRTCQPYAELLDAD